jgi:hypothetical protein
MNLKTLIKQVKAINYQVLTKLQQNLFKQKVEQYTLRSINFASFRLSQQ